MQETSGELEPELIQKLQQIPDFEGLELSSIKASRLGGLTNLNYRIECEKGTFVLRLAGPGTADYIARDAEKHNAQVAAEAGVNAELLFFDAADGTMLTRYVENSVTMSIELFKDLGAVQRSAHTFRKLHQCGNPFQGQFDLFAEIDKYLAVLRKLNSPIPEGYQSVKRQAQEVRTALNSWELPNAPCHCDPLYENFLDTGERMVLIDFEYAGNCDPMWDLGDLSVEAEFNEQQDQAMLEAYFGRPPSAFDAGRVEMYKGMCDLLWTLWGVVQHANNNPAEDFWTYSVNRLKRCQERMATQYFRDQLKAVQKGPLGE